MKVFKNRGLCLGGAGAGDRGRVRVRPQPQKPIAVEYHQWIADDAGLLTQETRQTLEEYNDQWNNKYTAVVAVATVDSTHGRSVEKYAAQLGKAWGLGPSDMLLLMVKGDHYYVLLGDSVNSTATDTQLNKLKNAVETDYYKNDYDRAAPELFPAADVVYAQIFQKIKRYINQSCTMGAGLIFALR